MAPLNAMWACGASLSWGSMAAQHAFGDRPLHGPGVGLGAVASGKLLGQVLGQVADAIEA
jgi:hypothetical protein